MKDILSILLMILLTGSSYAGSFTQSKKILQKITKEHHLSSFYLDCKIDVNNDGKMKPDLQSCNYDTLGNVRAKQMEAEHIVPISWIGQKMDCWSEGGRKNCSKVSEEFKEIEGDLVNLQYAVGEVNAKRFNYKYAELEDGFDFGSDGRVYFKDKKLSPPEEKRGWIARVHLYMIDKYDLKLDQEYLRIIKEWSKISPTSWECEYNGILEIEVGYFNQYTKNVCKDVKISKIR